MSDLERELMAYRDATLCVKSTNIFGREAKEIVGPCQAQENRFLVLFITSYCDQANNICLEAVNICQFFLSFLWPSIILSLMCGTTTAVLCFDQFTCNNCWLSVCQMTQHQQGSPSYSQPRQATTKIRSGNKVRRSFNSLGWWFDVRS